MCVYSSRKIKKPIVLLKFLHIFLFYIKRARERIFVDRVSFDSSNVKKNSDSRLVLKQSKIAWCSLVVFLGDFLLDDKLNRANESIFIKFKIRTYRSSII